MKEDKLKRWIALLLCGLHLSASAQTVLVQASHGPFDEYQARLQTDADTISPVKYYRGLQPSRSARDQLFDLFATAQKTFLEKGVDEARRTFLDVVARVDDQDWTETERRIFLTSFLRLAQFASNPKDQDKWLGQALIVSVDVAPDAKLFPPPLLQRLYRLRKDVPTLHAAEILQKTGWDKILIDGLACSRDHCPSFPGLPLVARITFLSNRWKPQTLKIPLSQLQDHSPDQMALLGGNCGSPQWSADATEIPHKAPFFGLNCAASSSLNLKPSLPIEQIQVASPSKDAKPFYRNPWFWAGVGGAVLVAIALGAQDHGSETHPTTTYGFSK